MISLWCATMVRVPTISSAIVYTLRHWAGIWRWLASVPLLFIIAAILKLVVELRIDPTSHNLWPFEMLATLLMATTLLGALYLARFLTQRIAQSQYTHEPHGK